MNAPVATGAASTGVTKRLSQDVNIRCLVKNQNGPVPGLYHVLYPIAQCDAIPACPADVVRTRVHLTSSADEHGYAASNTPCRRARRRRCGGRADARRTWWCRRPRRSGRPTAARLAEPAGAPGIDYELPARSW